MKSPIGPDELDLSSTTSRLAGSEERQGPLMMLWMTPPPDVGARAKVANICCWHLASFAAVHKIATRSEVCGHRLAPGLDRLRGL